jgi:hypothetical protein
MGDTEGRLHNLRQLHRGLDVLGPGFASEVAQSGGPLLRAIDQDLTDRLKVEIPVAREVAQKAGYLLVVLDEAPSQGLPDVQWGTRRKLVETAAHSIRVGLFDAQTGEPLARLRRDVDATTPLVPLATAEVRRQIHSCTLGLEVRRVILDGKLLGVLSVGAGSGTHDRGHPTMIKHIGLMQFDSEAPPEQVDAVLAAMADLVRTVDGLFEVHIGPSVGLPALAGATPTDSS